MSVRHTVSILAAAAAFVATVGTAGAQDYALCVKLERRLVELEQGQGRGNPDSVRRYNAEIMQQQRMLSAARRQAAGAGCLQRSGFLLFQPPRPASCQEHDAIIKRIETNVQRLQARRREIMPVNVTATAGERRRILTMLGDNLCGPQYERYATRNRYGSGGYGNTSQRRSMFLRDYTRDPFAPDPGTRDPYMTDRNGGPSFYYGTFRTLCVRKCDGFFWPISFSTVQNHFRYDEQLCQQSCPTGDVELFVHRNPGGTPEDAISLVGQPISSLPNAFRYRNEVVEDCTCQATVRTASLGDRVVVDLASRNGMLPPNQVQERERIRQREMVSDTATMPIPIPRTRPGNEPPVAGSIATLTGLEDFNAVPAPAARQIAGTDVRVVGPASTLYRSVDE